MAATAELALAAFVGLDEKAAMTLEALTMRDDSDFAEAMAAGVDIVVIGLTEPLESVVPVTVWVVVPSGPSVVIMVVINGGPVNCEDGNGL